VFPELVVHADQTVSGDNSHRDLVGEFFCLKVRVVGEHPHMTQLVRHRGIEFLRAQSSEETIFNCKTERLSAIQRRFDRDDEGYVRMHRHADGLRDTEFTSQSIDDELDPLDEKRGWFCGCGRRETREGEEDEPTGR
jgi:hypothetical protein